MQNKPEFRMPSIGNATTLIPATLGWLYDQCDEYTPSRKEYLNPGDDPENGQFWRFRFLLWKGQHELVLEIVPHGLSCLWVQFVVNGESTRTMPTDLINVMELTRRVRDLMTRIYRFEWEHEDHGDEDFTFWMLSFIEGSDGYEIQRKWVFEKFFVLDPVTSWLDLDSGETVLPDPDEPTLYIFMPKELTEGENAIFFKKTTGFAA